MAESLPSLAQTTPPLPSLSTKSGRYIRAFERTSHMAAERPVLCMISSADENSPAVKPFAQARPWAWLCNSVWCPGVRAFRYDVRLLLEVLVSPAVLTSEASTALETRRVLLCIFGFAVLPEFSSKTGQPLRSR